jgi:hypothetical protein
LIVEKDLISACQMFLVPASILFTALGVAKTEGLKSGVSFLGVIISLLWLGTIYTWGGNPPAGRITAYILASTFLAVAGISLVVHGMAFGREVYGWWKSWRVRQAAKRAKTVAET